MMSLLGLGAATGINIGATKLTPLLSGRVAAAATPVTLSSLYEERGAVIFAVRRPG